MAAIIDILYTFKFIKILSSKWTNMDAYKNGIIDKDGKALKKSHELESNKEKNSYTHFHRLVFKFKRMMEKIPGGKSATARYGAALALIKEDKEIMKTIKLSVLERGLKKHYINKERGLINEEGEGGGLSNTTAGIAGKPMPLGKKKNDMHRRKDKKVKVEDDTENTKNEAKNEAKEPSTIRYQMIGNVLVRVDEGTGKRKKLIIRVRGGKKSRKRETVSGKKSKFTRTGNRKLRGAKLQRKRRSLRKANRKSKTGAAKTKRARSNRKRRRFVH